MVEIDGSEGGGQILRNSLALAAVTAQPVRLSGIRGSRPEPGLKPQHLAVVDCLAEITDARVDGVRLGAETIEFDPGTPRGGTFTAEIGTAGSISLLFDAILPLAVALDDPISVTATGGTEVEWSPPLVSHERVKLPLCRPFGLQAAIERHRTGFYPAGGGSATLSLQPSTLSALDLGERGKRRVARCYSIVSRDLADSDVGIRQAESARAKLERAGIGVQTEQITRTETASTGSALVIELEYEQTRAGFDALGEPGVPAEEIATRAVEDAVAFDRGEAAVDGQLADQLLVFLALAGGDLSIPAVTDHVQTSLDLLEQFGFDLALERGRVSAPAP